MNFWDVHGVLFIVCLFFFPRLTLLVATLLSWILSGGILWWLGWLLTPRLLVAILATNAYWETNPVLVVLSWFWAFGLESTEKRVVVKRFRKR